MSKEEEDTCPRYYIHYYIPISILVVTRISDILPAAIIVDFHLPPPLRRLLGGILACVCV
jgi:hypothetical protein